MTLKYSVLIALALATDGDEGIVAASKAHFMHSVETSRLAATLS
jgi:hypothetical protein